METSFDYCICLMRICEVSAEGNKALCNIVRNSAPIICHVIKISGFAVFPETFFYV